MNKLLAFTAVAEAVTGLGLLVAPSVVTRLLFGAEPSNQMTGTAIHSTRTLVLLA